MSELKVKEYWDINPCNSGWGEPYKEGTLEWFKLIEEKRELAYPHIGSFARYQDWKGKNVLEIGSGVGCDTVLFAKSGAYITAVDLSSHSADITSEHLKVHGLNGKAICANAESLPFDDCQFDLVYSWGVIHHSPNPPKIIDEVYRVMKEGATFKTMLYGRYSISGLLAYMEAIKHRHHPFVSLTFAYAEYSESPGTKAYTSGGIRRLLKQFTDVKIIYDLASEEDIINNSPRLKPLKKLMKVYPKSLASWYLVETKKGD